jgi:hypothetical protein
MTWQHCSKNSSGTYQILYSAGTSIKHLFKHKVRTLQLQICIYNKDGTFMNASFATRANSDIGLPFSDSLAMTTLIVIVAEVSKYLLL